MVRPISSPRPRSGGLAGLLGPLGGRGEGSREPAWWTEVLRLLALPGQGPAGGKGEEIPDPSRSLAQLVLASLPLPACLVRASGERFAWGPRWEELERSLGRDTLQLLLARARGVCASGCSGEEKFLLQAGSRWFRFSRSRFLGGTDPILWTVQEVTAELGLFFREREDRVWIEETLRSLGAWSGDPRSFGRALAGAVSEKTGLESVQVYWKTPSRGVLTLLGGTPDPMEYPEEIALEERTPLGWVAASGRRKILEPSAPGGGWDWDPLDRMKLRHALLLPLSSQGQVLGVLLGGTRRFRSPFPERLLLSLETVCRAASDLLNMGELYRESRASEAEWKKVFFALDHPLFLLNQEGRILRANPAAARALGWENPEELAGIPSTRLIHGTPDPPKDCLVRRTLRTGRSAAAFRDLPRLGGRCLLSAHPLPGPGGEPCGAILFARKVSRELERAGGGEGGREGLGEVKELRRQRDMLARFLGAAAGIFRVEGLRERLLFACRTIREAGLYRKVSLGLLEGREKRFRILASQGGALPEEVLLGELEGLLPLGEESVQEDRFRIGNSFFVPAEARLPGEEGEQGEVHWESRSPWREGDLLLVPLWGEGGKVLGLLVMEDPFDGMRPSEGTVRALELLARLTLSAIEHSLLSEGAGQDAGDEFSRGLRKEGAGRFELGREAAELPRGRGQLVLVVDDEEAVLNLFKVFLSYLGYRFLPARRAGEALDSLREKEGEVAAAVVDYTLADMDGRDLVRAMKKESPGLPVVLTSGLFPPSEGEVVEDAFLPKPFHLEDVAHLLHALVG